MIKAAAERAPERKQIFTGVVFHINGYTQPSHYELKKLLVERGGRFLHYLSKTQVSHIIASSLSRSKQKELRNYRVVRPEWIVDSVKIDRLLPWASYRLDCSRNAGIPLVSSHGADDLDPLVGRDGWSQGAVIASGRAPRPAPYARPPLPPPQVVVDRFNEGLNREWVRRNLATEPDFIERYYANSRLHHLSTWKAEMKDYVAQLRRQRGSSAAPSALGCERVIMHVDFDCFFVSASLLEHPRPPGAPVAVCHSEVSEGQANSSQIASCNYAARSFGVRNGMFVGQARELCPALETVPYCFEAYGQISRKLYAIVASMADEAQAVSVDEALLDVSRVVARDYGGDSRALAEEIRRRVLSKTQCVVSVGIGPNVLLARLATAKAKPDGVYMLDASTFYQMDLSVRDLPSVGGVIEESLARHGIRTVADIRATPLHRLKEICGDKTAETLYNYGRGIDDRVLESDKPRQAFGADIGWGVRFSNQSEADDFVRRLASEVCTSMKAFDRTGSLVTLKVKRRQEGQGKPGKFLGHGICDSLSKSASLPQMTSDPAKIAGACTRLLQMIAVDPLDIRGVGIQVQRLNSLEAGLDISEMFSKPRASPGNNNSSTSEVAGAASSTPTYTDLPSSSQLDPDVINELPESIRDELRAAYHQMDTNSRSNAARSKTVSPGQAALMTARDPSPRTGVCATGGRRGKPRKLAFNVSGTKPQRPKADLLQAFRKVEALDSIMPSQIDRTVWDDLPQEIRRELARDYAKSKPPPVETKPAVMPATRPASPPQYSGPVLLGRHALDDIRSLIREWVSMGNQAPLEDDIDMFSSYATALVDHCDLKKASCVLAYLKYCVRDKNDAWRSAATTIIEQANCACSAKYGARLDV
ncbi:deoxycytidyl transferase [Coemansia sp. RSA 552]|nr:deoxycytidyl transferase [Coemansia sp. RSA 552]